MTLEVAVAGESLIENGEELRRVLASEVAEIEAGANPYAVFRASVELVKNLTVEARAGGHRFFIDEPPSFGGAGAGPNPLEVILAGVGACQAITAALWAARLGISIRRYHVDVKARADLRGLFGLTDDLPIGFEGIVCEVTIEADGTDEALAEFEAMVESRCPGIGTVRLPVALETRWQLNGRPVGPPAT